MDAKGYQQSLKNNYSPEPQRFLDEVLDGLQKTPKELPPKYFYDECGSQLYERICTLDEYYIPRTESSIMNSHIQEMVESMGPNVLLVEYGCGNCKKTRILLDNMPDLAAYVPIDISREQLMHVTEQLGLIYPELEILPVWTDYTSPFDLPFPELPIDRIVVYFPGSSIGNFDRASARNFLRHVAGICGPGGVLLIGIDLKKDPAILHSAYNDREGITAAFNLNLLERINHELNGDFQSEYFQHHAFYNQEEGRVEMHLVSLRDQIVHLDNLSIPFRKNESIWTESSYKYRLDEFEQMAAAGGFLVEKVWTDEQQWFGVLYLVAR